jgi:hypothetical protein
MFSEQNLTKQNITAVVFFLYLFPIILLSIYGLGEMPPNSNWNIFAIGLFGGIVGSITLFWLMHSWSEALKKSIEPVLDAPKTVSSIKDVVENEKESSEHSDLFARMSLQSTDLQRLSQENEQSQKKVELALQELDSYKNKSNNEIQQREKKIQDCQNMLLEQSALIDKQKIQITKLEEREKDLTFEVKTLLKLTKG